MLEDQSLLQHLHLAPAMWHYIKSKCCPEQSNVQVICYSLYLHLNKTPHPSTMLLCETKKRTHFRAFEDPQSLFSLKWHKVLKNYIFARRGEGALLAGRSWRTSPGRRRGRGATATSLCPVTWGQCSTPTCRFSYVQFVIVKLPKTRIYSQIEESPYIPQVATATGLYWSEFGRCWWRANTIIVFVLFSWCDRRAALSETIAAL